MLHLITQKSMKKIMEDKEPMDNRHFVHELKVARHRAQGQESSETKYKDLFVSFRVHSINEISQKNQRFQALFNVYVAWDEDVENININEDQIERGKWEEDMFFPTGKQSKVFYPRFRYINCIGRDANEREEWYRVVKLEERKDGKECKHYKYLTVKEVKEMQKNPSSDRKMIRVMWARRTQGWFEESFEMHHFPLDVQHLHIGITTRWDYNEVGISFDKYNPPTVASDALTSQGWELHIPRVLSFLDDWSRHTLPLLTCKTDAATGERFCRAYFALTVARKPGYIMWNVFVTIFLVGLFTFATYVLDPIMIEDRLSVVLTLVLTTVAFKFVTMQMVPEIPYLTMIDFVIYGCMFLQALMLTFVSLTAMIPNKEWQALLDWIFCGILALVWLSILFWFFYRFFSSKSRRKKYLRACNDYYFKTFLNLDPKKCYIKSTKDNIEKEPGNMEDYSISSTNSLHILK